MIRITSIEQALRNFAKTPINLSHKADESQMQVLCKKQFGWEATYPNQKGDREHAQGDTYLGWLKYLIRCQELQGYMY